MRCITVDYIMKCQLKGWTSLDNSTNSTRARLKRLFAGRERITARDVAALDIPPHEAVWMLTRGAFMEENAKLRFAHDCLTRVLHLFENEYPGNDAPRKAVEALSGFIAGKTSWDAVYEAGTAALVAFDDATTNASGLDAAALVAGAASYARSQDAKFIASWTAGAMFLGEGSEARDAERKWQIQRALELIESEGEQTC